MFAGLWALVLTLIISCEFPFQRVEKVKLSDISGKLGYNEISRQAFIGGSLLYNPDQMSSGHLAAGVHVAVRLGKVDRDDAIPEQPGFTDRADDARYGYITVNTVNASHISFSYSQYDAKGFFIKTSIHTVNLNEATDIDGDGIPDITYSVPARKRPGMEKAVYLTFLSSQDTLNTTMFSVIPEQYSRGAYPNGMMGINPDGRFIIAKYEHENSPARSAVKGLVYGDFVMDNQTGNYQKVIGPGKYRTARSVDDSDLTDLSSSNGKTDLYFAVEEFDGILTAENLFRALPVALQNRYAPENFSNETLIPILNSILESYDLIVTVAADRDVGLTGDELAEVRNGIHQIALEEVVQINRLFLNEIYSDVCPEMQTNTDDIAFILPLLHVVIRGEDGDMDISRAAASSYNAYTTRRNAIRSNFSKYKVLGTRNQNILFPNKTDGRLNKNTNAEISFGVYGSVENNWGSSIKMNIYAAVFLQVEWTEMNPAINLTKRSLLPAPITIANISASTIVIGVVSIDISCPIKFDIDLTVNGKEGFTTAWFMGYTGMFGAGVSAGANYGISWEKVLFIRLPVPYFSPFFSGEAISDYTYYVGPVDSNLQVLLDAVTGVNINNYSATVELTPRITISPTVAALKMVNVRLEIDNGLTGRFTLSALPNASQLFAQRNMPFTGSVSLFHTAEIRGNAGVGITSILGIPVNLAYNFPSRTFASYNRQIGSTIKVF